MTNKMCKHAKGSIVTRLFYQRIRTRRVGC